jgi:hypothetical protein
MVSAVSGSTAALQGQIKRDQLDLHDWVTCVSAKTPKGQAEIQKISGEISSAKDRIARIEASEPSARTTAPGSNATAAASATTSRISTGSATTPSHSRALEVPDHGGRVDVWA